MMRAAIWFVGLFALAVAVALFAGNNRGIVSVFWPPYRLDLSLNMVLMVLVSLFAILHLALRALSALVLLPKQAKQWRQQQKERKVYQALVDSISHLQAGRYVRARKSALGLIKLTEDLRQEQAHVPHDHNLRAIAHMLAADSAHALRDSAARDAHYAQALEDVPANGNLQQQEIREGSQMRAARWALDDRDPQTALERVEQLPPGARRRTMTLRMQLKANRLLPDVPAALDNARLLAKHGGLSETAANSIIRGLVTEQLQHTHDTEQLQRLWSSLHPMDRSHPDVAMTAARQWLDLQGTPSFALQWLHPIWEQLQQEPQALSSTQIQRLLALLPQCMPGMDSTWLARFETVHRSAPHDARWQYLAGMACMEQQLWGKAEQLLQTASTRLPDARLRASAWKALATMAEQREDHQNAALAWRHAAQEALA